MRASAWAPIPVLVDKVVRNIRVQEGQKFCRAGQRKYRVHGLPAYPFELYLSVQSREITILECKSHVIN